MLFNLSVQFLTNSMLSAFMLSQLLPGRATGCTPSWVGFGRAELCPSAPFCSHCRSASSHRGCCQTLCFLFPLLFVVMQLWSLDARLSLWSLFYLLLFSPPPSFPRTAPAWEPAAAPSQGNPRLILCRILLLPSFIPPPAF